MMLRSPAASDTEVIIRDRGCTIMKIVNWERRKDLTDCDVIIIDVE
jgi:hypothetical protein